MKIVSWNMKRSSAAAWQYLLAADPDIALLQEVGVVPAEVTHRYRVRIQRAIKKNYQPQNFSTAILCKGEFLDQIPLSTGYDWVDTELVAHAGHLVAHQLMVESKVFNVISVYSPYWNIPPQRIAGRCVQGFKLSSKRSKVWLIEFLWLALRNLIATDGADNLIVGGDFNSSPSFDLTFGSGNQEIQDRFSALGLVECLRHCSGKLTPTFRSAKNGSLLHQLDHLFVSESLIGSLVDCGVGDVREILDDGLSDHLPVIANLNF